MSVENDVKSYLVAGGFTSATATFVGPARPAKPGFIPAEAVFVLAYGGPQPNGFQDGLNQTYRKTDVQVRIRGKVNDYPNTVARAERVWQALNRTEAGLTTPTTDYVRVQPLQSGPIYIGQDDLEHDECVVNVRCETLTYPTALGTIYFGASVVDIDTLGELALLTAVDANALIDFSANAATGEYIYYVVPPAFGTPVFTFNGFSGGFAQYATIGSTVVYRSVQTGLGATNMSVSRAD